MASVYFFATRSDHMAILDFVTTLEGVRIFETSSEFGKELREFGSFDELASAYDVGTDKHGSGVAIGLTLWWPGVDPDFEIRRYDLRPEYCQGHTVRWAAESRSPSPCSLGGFTSRP